MTGVNKGEAARDFRKTTQKGQHILGGEHVDIIDMNSAERMMLLVDLAEAVRYNTSAAASVVFGTEMSGNLFRFLNTHFSWQETLIFIHLIKHDFDISFVDIMATELPECKAFAERMREYLRGII